VIGTLIGIVLIGESPAVLTWAGLAVVSVGMLVANWPAARLSNLQLKTTGTS